VICWHASLAAFNCQPVRFEAELADSLQKDFPEGLNSKHDFHFVFVDVEMVDEKALAEMRRLQKNAKFIFMCNSIALAKAMKRFGLTVRGYFDMTGNRLTLSAGKYFGETNQARFAVQRPNPCGRPEHAWST
jgi:hypothetical protein